MKQSLFVRSFVKAKFVKAKFVVMLGALLAALLITTVAAAQGNVHVVRRGENLSTIAQNYGMSLGQLMNINGISNPNVVYVGQQLLISGVASGPYGTPATGAPAGGGYYTVQRGDTLSIVAAVNGMSTYDLLRLNGLSNENFIWVGQRLRVSARVEPSQNDWQQQPQPELAGNIYVVQVGDTLSNIAQRNGTTVQALLAANGLPNANFVWVGQRLRITPGVEGVAENPLGVAGAPTGGNRWIDVNLSNQMLTAWQGDQVVMQTNVSSGVAVFPTVTGRFTIGNKYTSQRMTGPGYDIPDVPWVMYFYSGYAIHGAYWHNNFGVPMSHGCVNMRVGESQMLFNWAPAGTEVYVHY